MTKETEVTNDQGRTFLIRVVESGDNYGRDDCLNHDGETMIEFYDRSHRESFGERGQFVSRYYVSTLVGSHEQDGECRGLDLHGGVPVWQVTGENVSDALALARAIAQ